MNHEISYLKDVDIESSYDKVFTRKRAICHDMSSCMLDRMYNDPEFDDYITQQRKRRGTATKLRNL